MMAKNIIPFAERRGYISHLLNLGVVNNKDTIFLRNILYIGSNGHSYSPEFIRLDTQLQQILSKYEDTVKGKLGTVEIVMENYNMYELLGRRLPREICEIIDDYVQINMGNRYHDYKMAVPFRCLFCTRYIPSSLPKSKQDIIALCHKRPKQTLRLDYNFLYMSGQDIIEVSSHISALLEYLKTSTK